MPGNILNLDTSFPQLTQEQSVDEKFGVITNYLYMLLEQLRYSMANLGRANINDAEFNSIADTITQPVFIRIEDVEGNVSSLQITAQSLTSRISDAEGNISAIDQYAKGIKLSVKNGAESSTITLTSGGTQISSQTIKMTGLVTFSGLAGGTTTIDGACIKTGTINAQRLNLTGAVSFSDLNAAAQARITGAESAAASAQATASGAQSAVNGWTYPGSTYIDGGKIMTGTVKASTLAGGMIQLLESSGTPVGYFTIASTGAGFGIGITTTIGGIRITSSGNIWLTSNQGSESLGMADGYISCGADTMPRDDGIHSLGRAAYRWAQVYAASSEIVTSDREEKNTINYDLARYDALFDALKPCSYRYNNGKSGRTHTGLIAQDVEQAMADIGMESTEFAGFIREQGEDRTRYALRYEELIPLCIRQIQALKRRVGDLEGGKSDE